MRLWQANNPGKVIRLDEFGRILDSAIKYSFKSTIVTKGSTSPVEVDSTEVSEAHTANETVPIPKSFLLDIIGQIDNTKALLYRSIEPEQFTDKSEKNIASIYRTILAPLDQREIKEVVDIEEIIIEDEYQESNIKPD